MDRIFNRYLTQNELFSHFAYIIHFIQKMIDLYELRLKEKDEQIAFFEIVAWQKFFINLHFYKKIKKIKILLF